MLVNRDDKKDLFLDPGVHEFPFDFVLPPVIIFFDDLQYVLM